MGKPGSLVPLAKPREETLIHWLHIIQPGNQFFYSYIVLFLMTAESGLLYDAISKNYQLLGVYRNPPEKLDPGVSVYLSTKMAGNLPGIS